MRIIFLKSLLLPLVAGFTFAINAAPVTASAPVAVLSQAQSSSGLLNVNTANAAMLERGLNGIGKSKAEAIVAYREANGAFASVDELLEIKGIGKALLERNRGKLSVD